MKLIARIFTALLLLAGAGSAAAQNSPKEQLTVPLSAPGKPGVLHLKLVSGSIRVEGYNGKDVVVEFTPRGDGRDSDASPAPAGMRRIAKANGLDLTAEEKDNQVHLRIQSWQRPVDFTIKVPRQFSLRLGTVNNGNIAVENVSGELEISNVNGGIRLSNVAGSAVLNTVNGDVTANFRDVTVGVPMAFSSVNGRIDITFPPKVKTALKVKSDRGEIYSDFELSVESKAPKTTRTAKDGTYRVNVDNWTYGRINGGGPEFMMKTLNGDIYIRKAK